MATFLTTSKMHPALVARIEASVRGRRREHTMKRAASLSPRIVSLVRVVVVVLVGLGIYTVVMGRRRDRQELERTRAALLAAVRGQSSTLTPEDRNAVSRAESWLVELSGPHEGNFVAQDIRGSIDLKSTFSEPLVYVRGPSSAFKTPALIEHAASTSMKDALLLCLVDPPESRSEKALLEKVRIAYAGGLPMEERTSNARRLDDEVVGLPILLPQWQERVRAADDGAALAKLRRELDRAPLDRAKQAIRARHLLVAMDEPSDGGGPTELDGERAHHVRVMLVDLMMSKTLLRFRKLVDPSWISLAKKSDYAVGLDSCGLAYDVHHL
jgi:hypothetical protein